MQVQANTVVSINYILRDDDNQVLDQSAPEAPLVYLHGHNNIIPGLENALFNKTVGDSINVTIPPVDAYGEYDEELIQAVPRAMFEGIDQIEPGMQFQAQMGEGIQIVTVTAADDETVTIDANHDLAGKTLHFEASIVDIREATESELSHGHIHSTAQSSCCDDESCENN